MSLTFYGWLFVASSIPILLHFLLGTRSLRKEHPDLEDCKASLEEIATRLKNREINDTEADAARLALLSPLPSQHLKFSKYIPGFPHMLFAASAAFLLASGVGAAVYYDGSKPEAAGMEIAIPFSGPDGELLTQLTDYARSLGSGQTSLPAAPSEFLPDVNAMIERLAARLESTPQDLEGWRMLGWSYFQTERYEQAAAAFGKALQLDPGSTELKLSYEEAKAKASGSANVQITSSLQPETTAGNPSVGKFTTPEALPERERDVAIRSMVNGLANRLESSPQDVEGWIHLMRSRVVLGEHEMAATTFRKARAVFVEDSTASGRIEAAAAELGLKSK
jgi:cytochrome c-type biogenesis protein CcmH/NrfG